MAVWVWADRGEEEALGCGWDVLLAGMCCCFNFSHLCGVIVAATAHDYHHSYQLTPNQHVPLGNDLQHKQCDGARPTLFCPILWLAASKEHEIQVVNQPTVAVACRTKPWLWVRAWWAVLPPQPPHPPAPARRALLPPAAASLLPQGGCWARSTPVDTGVLLPAAAPWWQQWVLRLRQQGDSNA